MSAFQKGITIFREYHFINDRRVCVKPLRSRLEAIQKLKPPMIIKGCRSLAGMVNFLSLFCPELPKILKPIHDQTRKGRQFISGEEEQQAFDEIKRRLVRRLEKLSVLHLPGNNGRFHLYSDTNKFATGSVIYQIQNGKLKLLAYVSKRLPEEAQNYSIRNVWFSYKYCQVCSSFEKGRF